VADDHVANDLCLLAWALIEPEAPLTVVRGDEISTHLLNAVSPAWTSALAMANHVCKKFD
jgi:hypothetical protein